MSVNALLRRGARWFNNAIHDPVHWYEEVVCFIYMWLIVIPIVFPIYPSLISYYGVVNMMDPGVTRYLLAAMTFVALWLIGSVLAMFLITKTAIRQGCAPPEPPIESDDPEYRRGF